MGAFNVPGGEMRKSRRRRTAPRRSGTYRGFRWERQTDSTFGEYFKVCDHKGTLLGGSSDYRDFIRRWQAKNGVPPELASAERLRDSARTLQGFLENELP